MDFILRRPLRKQRTSKDAPAGDTARLAWSVLRGPFGVPKDEGVGLLKQALTRERAAIRGPLAVRLRGALSPPRWRGVVLFLASPRGESERHAEQRRDQDELPRGEARRSLRHQRHDLRQRPLLRQLRSGAPLEREREHRQDRKNDRDSGADQRGGDRPEPGRQPREQRDEQSADGDEGENPSDQREGGPNRDAPRLGLCPGPSKSDELVDHRGLAAGQQREQQAGGERDAERGERILADGFAQLVLGLDELLVVGEEIAPFPIERRGRVGGLRAQLVEVRAGDQLLGAIQRLLGMLGGRGQRPRRRRPARVVVLTRHVRLRRLMRFRDAWATQWRELSSTGPKNLPHFEAFGKAGPRRSRRSPGTRGEKRPPERPARAARQHRIRRSHFDGGGGGGSSVTVVTPPAMLSPVWPSSETGCNEKARPVPPRRTFAPTPGPALAWAPTPP